MTEKDNDLKEVNQSDNNPQITQQQEGEAKRRVRRERLKERKPVVLTLGRVQKKNLEAVHGQGLAKLIKKIGVRKISDIPHTPRKLRRLRNILLNRRLEEAIAQLVYAPAVAGKDLVLAALRDIRKTQPQADIFVSNFVVNEGIKRRKLFQRARGSANTIRRRMSHALIQYVCVER